MLPFGKVGQMPRTFACGNVPLTTVFDSASPNGHINNLLNELNYFQHEEIKRKQQIKKATRHKSTLLQDYSKKTETASKSKSEPAIKSYKSTIDLNDKNLDYYTTDKNRRMSPEFLQLLHKHDGRAVGWTEPIKPLRPIPHQYGVCNNDDTRHWEQVEPGLAKYLRDTMERNDLMSKLYNINFYDTPNPQSLKHILTVLNQKGVHALLPFQLAKLNKFLEMSSQQSPEEFERQLGDLKADGFLNKEMVEFTQTALKQNNGNIGHERLRKHLAALKKVESYQQGGGGALSQLQLGRAQNRGRRNALTGQDSKYWSTFAGKYDENWNASPGENNGTQYSYDYQQNAGRIGGMTTSKKNPYIYGVTESEKLRNDILNQKEMSKSREEVFDIQNYSFLKPKVSEFGNQRKTERYENQYLKLLYRPNATKSDQDDDSISEKKSKYYVKRLWEKTPSAMMKGSKFESAKGKMSEEKIELEPIQYAENAFKNVRLRLKFISRLQKKPKPEFLDSTGKNLPMPERFATHRYFRPRKYSRKYRSDGSFQTNAVSFIAKKKKI